MRLLCVLAGVVLALAIPSRGHAAITYLTQQRFVQAIGDVNGQPTGQSPLNAVGFTPFNGVRQWTLLDDSGPVGSVRATQLSSLLADRVLFQASCQSEVLSIGIDQGLARSHMAIGFSIASPSAFTVLHSHIIDGVPGQKVASASLRGPTGFIFEWDHSHADPNTWPQSPFNGVLAAGQYQLVIDTFTDRGSNPPNMGTTSSNVAVELIIPAPTSIGSISTAVLICGRSHRRRRA